MAAGGRFRALAPRSRSADKPREAPDVSLDSMPGRDRGRGRLAGAARRRSGRWCL